MGKDFMDHSNKIIGALIGLARACENNPETENTAATVKSALAACADGVVSDEACQLILDGIYAEKNTVAPNCALCANPCGNTADYDMAKIMGDKSEIGAIKRRLLAECGRMAKRGAETELYLKMLSMVSYELEAEAYFSLLAEINKL